MKPGVDFAITGRLPHAAAVSYSTCATSGAVASPLTTSTSAISGAGLKKCRPATRCGARRPAAIDVIEIDDVLVASRHASSTWRSSVAKISRFTSSRSAAASTISAAGASSSSARTALSRFAAASACAGSSRPFSASRANCARMPASALSQAASFRSYSSTVWPAAAATCAMPAPIAPAPITPTTAAGASAPEFTDCAEETAIACDPSRKWECRRL